MRKIAIENLKKEKYSLGNIAAFKKVPGYSTLKINTRSVNGFLMVREGKCIYSWGDESVEMGKGSLIYLPYGSVHCITVLSEEFSFYRIDFSITDMKNDRIIFSDVPMLICQREDEFLFDIVKRMVRLFMHDPDEFLIKGLLYELFDRVVKIRRPHTNSDIENVISYLESNFSGELECEKLSEISFMSKSKMYRIFKKETGMTPVEYRNKIRVEKSKIMLLNNSGPIDEIAYLLGFENACYFSRMFKKYEHMSPSEYRKKNMR